MTDARVQIQEGQRHPPWEQPWGGGQITHDKKTHRCPSPETQMTGRAYLHCACGLDTCLICISPGCIDTAQSLGLPSRAELQSWGSQPGLGHCQSAPSLMVFVPFSGTCRRLEISSFLHVPPSHQPSEERLGPQPAASSSKCLLTASLHQDPRIISLNPHHSL